MRKPKRPEIPRVLAYVRVSTAEQAETGAGPEAQLVAIRAGMTTRGWELAEGNLIHDNGTSGTVAPDEREGLARALELLDGGQADVLIAAKIDRISRSATDFLNLIRRAKDHGWELITLDVDPGTPYGKMMRTMLAGFAELERDLIAMRTRDALAVKRSQGVILGRPVQIPEDVAGRIQVLRSEGLTWQAIADALNDASVPTARGGQWKWSTVRDVHARLLRVAAERP